MPCSAPCQPLDPAPRCVGEVQHRKIAGGAYFVRSLSVIKKNAVEQKNKQPSSVLRNETASQSEPQSRGTIAWICRRRRRHHPRRRRHPRRPLRREQPGGRRERLRFVWHGDARMDRGARCHCVRFTRMHMCPSSRWPYECSMRHQPQRLSSAAARLLFVEPHTARRQRRRPRGFVSLSLGTHAV